MRKKTAIEKLKKNHEIAGLTLSIIGVLYSVILGFTVVNVQERYNTINESIHLEANLLADLYRDAEVFPKPVMESIQQGIKKYALSMLNEEWDSMNDTKTTLASEKQIEELWSFYYKFSPPTEQQKIWYAASIDKLNKLNDARNFRYFNRNDSVSSMLWTLLIFGAILTISMLFFLGIENFVIHTIVCALLTGFLSFILFLIFTLDRVFEGPEKIQPQAFKEILELFEEWEKIQGDNK